MVGSDIVGLSKFTDLRYLQSSLALEKDEDQAAQYFKNQIDQSLDNSLRTQINNVSHNINQQI